MSKNKRKQWTEGGLRIHKFQNAIKHVESIKIEKQKEVKVEEQTND